MNYFECVIKNIKAHLPRSKWEKAKSFIEDFLEKKNLGIPFSSQEIESLLLRTPYEYVWLDFFKNFGLVNESITECELTPDLVSRLTASRDSTLTQLLLTSPKVKDIINSWLIDKNMDVSSVASQQKLYDSFVNSLTKEHQLDGKGESPDNLFARYSWGDDSLYWLNKGGSHRFTFLKLWGPKLNKKFTIKARLLNYSLDRAKVLEFTKHDQYFLIPELTTSELDTFEKEVKKLFPKYDFTLGIDKKFTTTPNDLFPQDIRIGGKFYRIIKLPRSRIDDHLKTLRWFNFSDFMLAHSCESNENQPQ